MRCSVISRRSPAISFLLATSSVPLIFWLLKKDEYRFVDEAGKESLNFQISLFIYYMISALLIVILIGFFSLIAWAIFSLIVTILASIKASDGESYHYPLRSVSSSNGRSHRKSQLPASEEPLKLAFCFAAYDDKRNVNRMMISQITASRTKMEEPGF